MWNKECHWKAHPERMARTNECVIFMLREGRHIRLMYFIIFNLCINTQQNLKKTNRNYLLSKLYIEQSYSHNCPLSNISNEKKAWWEKNIKGLKKYRVSHICSSLNNIYKTIRSEQSRRLINLNRASATSIAVQNDTNSYVAFVVKSVFVVYCTKNKGNCQPVPWRRSNNSIHAQISLKLYSPTDISVTDE